ncbi:LolA family protein [Planctomonas psychrotolerans]|uniref:LolA family protein n=1 Tax=Planctomonas psychrotolerans TaxID=2528712 RepID=UPI00123914B7|nr:DUF2092 domain-containing protein [Planctomonas psychrotolerans]
MSSKWMRWLPAAIVPAVVVTAAVAIPATAGAAPTLPEKSADEVLAMIADSTGVAFSGTLEQRSDLGLPDIPTTPGSSELPTGALEFLTGSHTVRAFVGDSSSVRLQVLDDMAERDVIINGDELWLYDSDPNEAVHVTLPEGTTAAIDAHAGGDAYPGYTGPRTPAEVATRLIEAIDPSTSVSVATTALVAGRSVYQLSLDPKSSETLVDGVTLSVDSETGLPLRVEVTAVGQDDPAVSLGFSAIDFSAPDASLFDFSPPAGATVTEKPIDPEALERRLSKHSAAHGALDAPHPTDPNEDHLAKHLPGVDAAGAEGAPAVYGSGWDAVVALPAMPDAAFPMGTDAGGTPASAAETAQLLEQLTTDVEGGRVLSTALVTVLITDDGRIFAGAVPVERLQAAAAGALER